MKPRSISESYWRTMGHECRQLWKQGPGAALAARGFTRQESNRAMRMQGKLEAREGIAEFDSARTPTVGSSKDMQVGQQE